VLGPEEAVRRALTAFYAEPAHAEFFEEHYLDRLTLGAVVARLKPFLDHFEIGEQERAWLHEVVEMRN